MCRYGHRRRSLTLVLQKDNALQLWGHPTSFPDIADLFAKFCAGQLVALPWSDSAPSQETGIISNQLAKMNRLGFLTINSQPAVNGVRSDDKIFGWGPSNGYVYQKVWASLRPFSDDNLHDTQRHTLSSLSTQTSCSSF